MAHSITLQNIADTDIVNNDILGQICFAAPNEASVTGDPATGDSILIAASMFARSEGTFAVDNNATELVFVTGSSESAAPGATNYDMTLSSAGNLTIAGAIELGHASDTTLARASSGDLNVEGNLIYRAGGTDVPLTDGGTGASSASGARTSLGLAIGSDVQAYDAQLASVAGWTAAQVTTIGNIGTVTTASDKMIYTTSADTFAETAITTFARTILDDADEATFKATVNLEIGTDVQAYDAQLDTLAALTANQVGGLVDLATLEAPASDGQFIVATGSGAFAYESGATARTSLGLVIGTNVQAYDAQLDTLAALTADQVGGLVDLATLEAPASDGQFIVATGSGAFAYESGATARTSLGVDAAGTDNSTAVTLVTSSHDYLSISTQAITLGTIDIGDDTNLAAGTGITLTGDTLSVDAAQTQITSLGTLTTLTVDDIRINGTTIGHTSDTDLMTIASGGLTLAGTLTVGVNDTGHDVKFFGASDGSYMLWDEDADDLIVRVGDIIVQDASGNTEIAMDSSGTLVLGVNGDRQIRVDNQSGTNTTGSHLDLRAGKSTGTGAGGKIVMYTGTTGGGSGSGSNAHAIALTLDENQTAQVEAGVYIKEAANANGDTADYGQLWVKNANPNQLYFTDDAGNDKRIVNGTGDTGYLAYWSDALGTLTYDNNQLFWDASSNELGIGTATPGSSLDVSGSVGYKPFMISSSSGEGDTDWATLGVNTYEIGSAVTYLVETGDTARTIELPDPASSIAGRTYTIKKIDSGTGTVTIQPYAAGTPPAGGYIDGDNATIDDGTNILFAQYDTISATCAEGTTSDRYEWHIVQEKVHPHCAKLEQQSSQNVAKNTRVDVAMTHTIFAVGCSVVDPTNDVIIITRKGKYLAGGYIRFDDMTVSSKHVYLELQYYDASATATVQQAAVTNTPSSSDTPGLTTTAILDLDVDDQVKLVCRHTDSSTTVPTLASNDYDRAFLWVQEIK